MKHEQRSQQEQRETRLEKKDGMDMVLVEDHWVEPLPPHPPLSLYRPWANDPGRLRWIEREEGGSANVMKLVWHVGVSTRSIPSVLAQAGCTADKERNTLHPLPA